MCSARALRNPQEAFRRVDFDARIEGAVAAQLVALCFEQAEAAMAGAAFADDAGNNHAKSKAMTKALAAIAALQLGVSGEGSVAAALRQFYGAARRALLDCALNFDPATVQAVRSDLHDFAGALVGSKTDS
ncbi:MAG: flagellar protein FliS [Novosphingobium sp.]